MFSESPSNSFDEMEEKENKPLCSSDNISDFISKYFEIYLKNIGNTKNKGNFYNLLTSEIDRAVFQTVLCYTKWNQSKTAEILGINRNTLRQKLKNLGLSYEKKIVSKK